MHIWHLWAIAAIVLMLMELFGAHFVLLGLGLAALVVALVAVMVPGIGIGGQLGVFTLSALVIVPGIVWLFRCFFPNHGPSVMNEPGNGAAGPHEVVVRNGRIGVEIYGDFYPARFPNSGLQPQPGTQVTITEFRGITAMVKMVSDNNQ